MNETTYTSFDLMKIFGIKKGSWYNVVKLDQGNPNKPLSVTRSFL